MGMNENIDVEGAVRSLQIYAEIASELEAGYKKEDIYLKLEFRARFLNLLDLYFGNRVRSGLDKFISYIGDDMDRGESKNLLSRLRGRLKGLRSEEISGKYSDKDANWVVEKLMSSGMDDADSDLIAEDYIEGVDFYNSFLNLYNEYRNQLSAEELGGEVIKQLSLIGRGEGLS